MHGLRQEIAAGRLQGMRNIVFIHTGGIFGLFPFSQQLKAILKKDTP
jgi:D-cysteine desulfhydrase